MACRRRFPSHERKASQRLSHEGAFPTEKKKEIEIEIETEIEIEKKKRKSQKGPMAGSLQAGRVAVSRVVGERTEFSTRSKMSILVVELP